MILPALHLLVLLTTAIGTPLFSKVTEKKDSAEPEMKKDTLRLIIVNPMEPYGWGQLTNEGRLNQYNQGLFLRERYDGFLGTSYSPNIFYLQSTYVGRTKMSAMLEAAALWKPNKEQSFKSDLPWQPVVLFYQEQSEDTLMLVWNTCPKYTQLRNSVNDLPEVQTVYENNKVLFEELTNFTGMPIANADDVSSFYATLVAEKAMNLTLPEWTKDYYPDKLIPLTLYSMQFNTYNNEFRKLKGGPMLKKFTSDMLAKKKGTLKPEQRKMFMFVGHDSTIVDLMNTMHIWHNQLPHYNIMIMIELHENEGEWNVQIFLRNTTVHEPYSLTIPGCTVVCPLDRYVEIFQPIISTKWEDECKADDNYVMPSAPLA